MKPILLVVFLIIAVSINPSSQGPDDPRSVFDTKLSASPYLFVWAGDEDSKDPDFLAVIDARNPTHGRDCVKKTDPKHGSV